MTSVLKLHDATNAYLWTKHDVAKQAANEMALKEIDKFFFKQRISLPVATICGEEVEIHIFGEIRFLAWWCLCSACCCESDVLSFSTRIGNLGEDR